jgi:CRISPR/Cas system endoribonuclease Cas6 (RAMP superfamily)
MNKKQASIRNRKKPPIFWTAFLLNICEQLVLNDVKDSSYDRLDQIVAAIVIIAVLILSVVTVFVTTLESLTEIVAIFVEFDIVVIVAVAGVLIAVRVLVTVSPIVLTVSLSSL